MNQYTSPAGGPIDPFAQVHMIATTPFPARVAISGTYSWAEDENKGMGDGSKRSEWHAKGEQDRIDFLQKDLALCFTFVDLAQRELRFGDGEAARQALAKAETGYATVARFLPEVQDRERRHEIGRKWNELRAVLDSVHDQLQGRGAAQE